MNRHPEIHTLPWSAAWLKDAVKRGPIGFPPWTMFSDVSCINKQVVVANDTDLPKPSFPHDPEKYNEVSMGQYIIHRLEWADHSEFAEDMPKGSDDKIRIIPWSGGWDSTAYLFWYLQNTEYKIHAHHQKIMQSKREAEIWSISKMLPIAQAIRPFEFTQSSRDDEDIAFHGFAVQNAAYIGFQIARGYYNNGCKDIEVCLGIYRGEMPPTIARTLRSRQYRAWMLFDSLCADMDPDTRPFVSWKLCHMTKHQLAKCIPEQALKFVWTCEQPIKKEDGIDGFIKCGKCVKCIEERERLQNIIDKKEAL
jgi:hypothetical protein